VFSLVFRAAGMTVFQTGKAALLKVFFYSNQAHETRNVAHDTRFTRKPLKTLNFRTGPSKAILIICSLVFMGDKKTAVNAVIFSIVTYEKTTVTVSTEKIPEDKSGTS